MKKTVKIDVKEVAWHGDRVTKYQAVATYSEGEKVIKRIYGDPQPEKFRAIKELYNECNAWHEAAAASIDYLELEYNQ